MMQNGKGSRFDRLGCLALAAVLAAATTACDRTEPQRGTAWQQETAYFYPASQIDAGNVKNLGVAWEFNDFVVRGRTNRGVEATPVVADGVMYTSGPWSVVYALDAASGKLLWRYDPEVDGEFARRTCCDAVNRGVAVDGGKVYVATLDGYLVSLDAKTGKPDWKVDTITDRSRSYAVTGAPRIAGKNIVIGNGGGEMGTRGYASGFDKRTGKLAWRFFVVPGDPAAGPDESPDITEARKTWDPKSAWNLGGGGNPWDSIVYDPDTNTVFVGTGNGSPHPVWLRSPAGGDNLYLSSIVALDANTGRKKWHYQTTPGDSWDYTATQNMILADLQIGGRLRKVIMQAPKNGFFYVLDRLTGELLSAEKYTTVTWAERVDMKTGRPVLTNQSNFSEKAKLVWPSEAGGHNWPPMAFNEKTKFVYIPVLEAPMVFKMSPRPYQPYSNVQGSAGAFPTVASWGGKKDDEIEKGQPKPRFEQVLKAWDPINNRIAWTSKVMPFWSGGVMTTSNGLVMQGSADGYLTIYDAKTGAILHHINIGTGIMAAPMSYEIDGTQYVAVAAGFGGAMNRAYVPGWVTADRENTPRILVFKLGGNSPTLPPLRTAKPLIPAPAKYRGTSEQAARGFQLLARNCMRCHAGPTDPSGYPNLWAMSPETHEAFEQIVLGGAFKDAGMASFADVLTKGDVRDIHAFLAQPPKKQAGGPKTMH